MGNPQNKLKTISDVDMTVITCNARFLSASMLSNWLPLLLDQHQTAPDYRYALLRPEKWQVQGQHLADDLRKCNEDFFLPAPRFRVRMLWNVIFSHMGLDGKKCYYIKNYIFSKLISINFCIFKNLLASQDNGNFQFNPKYQKFREANHAHI